MRVVVTTPATGDPLDFDAVKTELRITGDEMDGYVERLIKSATAYFEQETGYALITRTLTAYLRFWPKANNILLPYPPLQDVTEVKYYPLGEETVWDSDDYLVDNQAHQGSILLPPGESWPAGVLHPPYISIEYDCGFGDGGEDVPGDILQCLMSLISWWDDVPEAVYVPGDAKAAGRVEVMPLGAQSIIERYRRERHR